MLSGLALSSLKTVVKKLAMTKVSSQGLSEEGSASQLTHMPVERIQIFACYWLKNSFSSFAI